MSNRNDLTLMEVIAVITVIIVLITILMPALVKSREWGKSIKCKANMKTISDAVISYTGNNQGAFPAPCGSWSNPSWTWYLQRQDYIPAPKNFIYTWNSVPNSYFTNGCYSGYPADYSSVWACPSEELAPQNRFLCNIVYGNPDYNTNFLNAGFYWQAFHYAMTRAIYYNSPPMRMPQLAKRLRGAATIGLLMENKGGMNGNTFCFWGSSWYSYVGTGLGSNIIWSRHFGRSYGVTKSNYNSSTYLAVGTSRINSIFLDGHVDSWTNDIWWNKYLTPLTYGRTPFAFNPSTY